MLCGAAKYLELDISVSTLMSLFDAAVFAASVYCSFEGAVSEQGYISIESSLVLYIPL